MVLANITLAPLMFPPVPYVLNDVTNAFPATCKLPPMPTPPVTTNAPEVLSVLSVASVNLTKSEASSVVNAPVAVVFAPIGKLSA